MLDPVIVLMLCVTAAVIAGAAIVHGREPRRIDVYHHIVRQPEPETERRLTVR